MQLLWYEPGITGRHWVTRIILQFVHTADFDWNLHLFASTVKHTKKKSDPEVTSRSAAVILGPTDNHIKVWNQFTPCWSFVCFFRQVNNPHYSKDPTRPLTLITICVPVAPIRTQPTLSVSQNTDEENHFCSNSSQTSEHWPIFVSTSLFSPLTDWIPRALCHCFMSNVCHWCCVLCILIAPHWWIKCF